LPNSNPSQSLKTKYFAHKPNTTVRFEVLTAASMKMAVFWVVALCSLGEVYDVSEVLIASFNRAVLAASIIRAITLMMEAVSTS
jgi:hypothetical protein